MITVLVAFHGRQAYSKDQALIKIRSRYLQLQRDDENLDLLSLDLMLCEESATVICKGAA